MVLFRTSRHSGAYPRAAVVQSLEEAFICYVLPEEDWLHVMYRWSLCVPQTLGMPYSTFSHMLSTTITFAVYDICAEDGVVEDGRRMAAADDAATTSTTDHGA